MEAQLDPGAADVLRRQFEQMGLVTHLATRTTAVVGQRPCRGAGICGRRDARNAISS